MLCLVNAIPVLAFPVLVTEEPILGAVAILLRDLELDELWLGAPCTLFGPPDEDT